MKRIFTLFVFLVLASVLTSQLALARELGRDEWYVRLIATADDGALEDRGNVLGLLHGAKDEKDKHDLRELSPFAEPYLSIVFYRPNWREEVVDYTSDYREFRRAKAETWQFEVRSDDPWREVTLSWERKGGYISDMALVDLYTGEVITVDSGIDSQSYTFNMNGQTVRPMQWLYNLDTSIGRGAARSLQVQRMPVSDWPPLGWPHGESGGPGDRLPPDPFGGDGSPSTKLPSPKKTGK